jgi:hypothetical protein
MFSRIVVAAAAAIALNALIAESMLELDTWSPRMGLVAIPADLRDWLRIPVKGGP